MPEELTKGIQFFLKQHGLALLNPDGLLLLLSIPVFAVIGLWMGKDLRWYRRLGIQLLRASVVAVLAVALARPVKLLKENAPAVVLLADLSDSMSAEARQRMRESIRGLWEARGPAAAFVVGFGREPRLLAGPAVRRISLPEHPGELPGRPGPGGSDSTDIAAALRFAYGLFPPGYDRRVVIYSDGQQTRGDLQAEAWQARELGIEVSTVFVAPASSTDVRADRLITPPSARSGDRLPVELELFCDAPRRVGVRLLLDGALVERRLEALKPGVNRVSFSVTLQGEGWHKLTAVAGSRDRYPENNRAACRIHASGRPRVLLLQRKLDQNPLRRLFEAQEVRLRVASVESLPAGMKELAEEDLLVLDDLPLAELQAETVERLKSYVEEFGGGLLLAAGQAAAPLAGPKDFPIEKLLPVHFRQVKKKEVVPAALVFVMDRSSSMDRGGKFLILLRAVVDALERLRDTTQVALVMFDDFPEVVVPLTEARHREKIRQILNSQRVGGGTSIYPALQAAHQELSSSAAKQKHVILLSDGQSISIYGHYGYVVEKLAKDQITVTTIALGADADQPELKRISGRSGGRFYFTDNLANVPKIFTAETENIKESDVVEQSIRAVPAKLVEVLSGIDFESAPPLKGYIAGEERPTSEVLLKSSDRGEPLLARWKFGLGQVTMLTTDAQGEWARSWTEWKDYQLFWSRLLGDTVRRTPPGGIRLSASREPQRAVLRAWIPAERPAEPSAPPRLQVWDPDGRETELALVRRGLGRYRAELALGRLGPYSFLAERRGAKGARERSYASLSHTYREEYLTALPNPELLEAVARATGGKSRPTAEGIFAPGRQERQRREDQWPPWVLAGLGLFLAEVLVRRI